MSFEPHIIKSTIFFGFWSGSPGNISLHLVVNNSLFIDCDYSFKENRLIFLRLRRESQMENWSIHFFPRETVRQPNIHVYFLMPHEIRNFLAYKPSFGVVNRGLFFLRREPSPTFYEHSFSSPGVILFGNGSFPSRRDNCRWKYGRLIFPVKYRGTQTL